MDAERVAKLCRWLTGTVLATIAASAAGLAIIFAGSASQTAETKDLYFLLILGCFCGVLAAGAAFHVVLGMLAHALGRSPIVWVGISFLTAPFGSLISYLVMRREVATALAASQPA
jgi:hypothetical protein